MNRYIPPFKEGDRVVDIGGGHNPLKMPGITVFNVDVRELPMVDAVRDLEANFSDIGEFDGLYCRYVAEHIGWRKIEQFFRNCYEVIKDGGIGVFIIPDTLAQMRKIINQPKITLADSGFLFGGQDFPSNIHKVVFSREFASELLGNAGFTVTRILNVEDPNARDIIIEVLKKPVTPMDYEKRKKTVEEMYDRAYFEDATDGYIGFWDFPVHFNTVNDVIAMKPESVLDVGAARGYIVKHLEARGIKATALDVSPHCWHTRATDSFISHDATKASWPIRDGEFDLLISTSFLEHIPEEQLPVVMREMARVSNRSYHMITFEITEKSIDTTHIQGTMKPREWWMNKFNEVVPGYPVKILTAEEATTTVITSSTLPEDDGLVKVNFGSHMCMFYYGWLNVDIIDLSRIATQTGRKFQQMDVLKPMPFPSNSVDLATAHHLVEHFNHLEAPTFLMECLRVLKPGGILRLSAPDAKTISGVYAKGKIKETYTALNVDVEKSHTENEAFHKLLWSGHKITVDEEVLVKLMEEMGFVNVKATKFGDSRSKIIQRQTIDSFPTLSCYVEGEKAQEEVPPIRDFIDRGPVITVEPDLEPYQKYLLEKT